MGDQFWWFYDALAVAAILVLVILSGRKGFTKAAISSVCWALAAVVAVSLSGSMSKSLYGNLVEASNRKKIDKTVSNIKFEGHVMEYMSLEYGVTLKKENVNKIYKSDKDHAKELCRYINNIKGKKLAEEDEFRLVLNQCYSEITRNIVKEELSTFAAESAAKKVLEDPESFEKIIPFLIKDEAYGEAAKEITKYTEDAYTEILRLSIMLVTLALFIAISMLITKSLGNEYRFGLEIKSHIAGGIIGVVKGAVTVLAIAAIVRLYVILGSDKMLFFNFKAIDETKIFKYFYNFILNKS